MHIATVPNRKAKPSYLLRETYREYGKVKNRTLANLSKLPLERINALRAALRGDTLVLYDVTSTYLEGNCCELAKHGYSRDGRPDRPQLVIGLLCAADGCPVAIEDFAGNTADPVTVARQIARLKDHFRLRHVALVGDRGMITSAHIEQSLKTAGLDWITALRAPAIRQLAAGGGPLQLSLFDDRDMAEITSPDYPGERLVVCMNPLLAEERRRHREDLLGATEADLGRIKRRVERAKNPLAGAAAIGQALGAVQDRRKMAKHFDPEIGETSFAFSRKTDAIVAEARLDGIYVLRTRLPEAQSNAAATVRACRSLAQVELAFRSLKTVDLALRPVFHWTADRVRAHVLLCMLAYYLEWHMHQQLASMLFDDHDKPAAEAERTSPVAKTRVSEVARRKAMAKRGEDNTGVSLPVHIFRTLIGDLATLTVNIVSFAGAAPMRLLAKPTPTQARACAAGVKLTAA